MPTGTLADVANSARPSCLVPQIREFIDQVDPKALGPYSAIDALS